MPTKILIVEDEAITSLDIQRSLETMGFEVVSTASNGIESIQKARDLKPDLILMDIMLKDEMDGIEAAGKISTFFDVPIIYITSYSDENTFKRAKLTKPYGFITKPFNYQELRASIEIAIYKHEFDKKLKESEARFHSLYENSFDAILLTKPSGDILAANPAAQKIFDMTEEEIIEAGRDGIIVKDENFKHAFKERDERGKFIAELAAKRKDGSIFPIEATSSLFTDKDGSVKTSMIIRDITKRKKAEENFRKEVKRESFLLDLYKKAPNLTDNELYDCALDHAVSLTDSTIGFFHLISDDQKNIILNSWNSEALKRCNTSFKTHYPVEKAGNWTDCIQTKGPVVYNDFKNSPNRKGFPEGHVPVKRFISIPVFDENKVKCIFGVGNKIGEYDDHDVVQIQSVANELYRITKQRNGEQALKDAHDNLERLVKERTEELEKAYDALKENETKFRELFNKAIDMISLTELNDDGTIKGYIEVNEAGVKRLGYSRDEFLNMTFLDLYLDSSNVLKIITELLEKGYSTAENVQVTKDGRQIPVELNTRLFKLRGRNVILVISRDITERKKTDKILNETIKELERSNDELQRFAYVTSHDLQEPLRTIASFTQLLERRYKGKLDEDADEFMDYIVEAAIRMKQMIHDLLEYSRLATKNGEFKSVNCETLLNNVINGLKFMIEDSNAEITHDSLPEVMADENQLYRVFQNLLSNAIKFRKENEPPRIHISASIDEEMNEYVFSFSDNSIGIDPQYFNRIFTIFQRLHTRDKYQGTGIGLSIVKRIIERHEGHIWVESEPGKGSTFYFTLPNL